MKKIISLFTAIVMIATMFTLPVSATEADGSVVNFDTMPIPTYSSSSIGKNIARTMYKLESSTAENPSTVRIMVEGQSISDPANVWVPNLIDWLRQKYPTANIEFKNFAIGGFSTQLLCKRVPNDVLEFRPDLMIFYAYGDHTKLEECIKFAREAGAEVMTQNCHYVGTEGWDAQYSDLMKGIAKTHGAEYCDIRTPWKKFLSDNKLDYKALLNDDVHLNSKGQTFMLELMKQHFVYHESNAADVIAENTKAVQASDWNNGKLEVKFNGIGAEIIAGSGAQHDVDVTIDGKKPSELKECYIRSCESHGMWDTNLGIIKFNSVPQEQKWTVKIDSWSSKDNFTVSASGSKTGDEGSGTNGLNGAHLSLTPDSFIWDFATPSAGKTYTFDSILNGTDTYNGSKSVVAFGLDNKEHTLVLTAKDASKLPDIKEIRFTNPSAKITVSSGSGNQSEKPADPTPKPAVEFVLNGNFEGPFEENMYDSGLDIPSGWAFWGESSMVIARGQGEGTSVGAILKPNTGSQNQAKFPVEYAGQELDFSATIKSTEALAGTEGIKFKIHAYGAGDSSYEGTPLVYSGTNTEFEKFTGKIKVPALDEIGFTPNNFGLELWTVSGSYIIDNISIVESTESIEPDEPAAKKKLDRPVIKKIKSTKRETVTITLKKMVKGAKKFEVKISVKKNFKGARAVKVKAKKVFKVKSKLLKKGKRVFFKVRALKTDKKKASSYSMIKMYKIIR